MQASSELKQKLEAFIRKYHLNDILRGTILFVSIGILYFLLTLLIEYFLWLPSVGRMILFWSFIVVEVALLYRWILLPLSKLLKLRKGISYENAAILIGNHFPEVSDKLLNALQLQKVEEPSELLFASIEQKTEEMKAISFEKAVSYTSNKKYLPYFVLPLLVFAMSYLVADTNWFGSSYKRVSNYNIAYVPPAPYSFQLLNNALQVVENQSFDLSFSIEGDRVPEEVKLIIEEETHYLEADTEGIYHFPITAGSSDLIFSIIGNNKVRQDFVLKVLPKPFIENMRLQIQPPAHTKIPPSNILGSGTTEVPEGSVVTWYIETRQSDALHMLQQDSIFEFKIKQEAFVYQQQVLHSFEYELEAINQSSQQKEKMQFRMQSVQDAFPSIRIKETKDSVEPTVYEFTGIAEDDYGLRSLRFVIHPSSNPAAKEFYTIPIHETAFEEFQFSFDTRDYIKEEGSYVYYFEITDNDGVNNYKTTRSDTGVLEALSSESIKDTQLDFQKDRLEHIADNLKKWSEENTGLEEIEGLEKTDEEVSWEDLQKLNAFTKQEKFAVENLEKLTEELKKSLDKMQSDPTSESDKEHLQERMQEQLEDLKKNQDLLDKLEEYQSKIATDELQKEIEEYQQQKKIQEKNLGQLLELTKRFYVSEKNMKLASDLMELGEQQKKLAETEVAEVQEEQEKLQDKFDFFKEEMEELMKENQGLLKPFSLHQDKHSEARISEAQQDALDKLEQDSQEDAKPSQKNAGEQMQELAKAMQQQQMQGGMESMAEDAGALRQILDNLVRFSFSQEEVMEVFKEIVFTNPKYGNYLTSQHDLKHNFRHINDSLFSLSLRQPSMGKQIHQLTTEIDDHIEVSLDDLAQNRLPKGVTQQQYALAGANELAVILSDILENMQMQMQSSGGSGEGSDTQLSDIIEQQESLMDGEEGEGEGEGENDGNSEGENASNAQGEQQGEGDSYMDGEGEDGSYYEIYKQQQQLKMQLEDYLQQHGVDLSESHGILEEMDALSLKLLEQGSTDATRRQMQQILHKLLELQTAALQQEEDEKRQAETNFKTFPGATNELKLTPKDQLPATEILNRESLQLKPYYRRKVQEFFN